MEKLRSPNRSFCFSVIASYQPNKSGWEEDRFGMPLIALLQAVLENLIDNSIIV
jgi:hypothetical protein